MLNSQVNGFPSVLGNRQDGHSFFFQKAFEPLPDDGVIIGYYYPRVYMFWLHFHKSNKVYPEPDGKSIV
jgi:hypothetical protein